MAALVGEPAILLGVPGVRLHDLILREVGGRRVNSPCFVDTAGVAPELRQIRPGCRITVSLMVLQAGTRLGPYEILTPLGAGGMGEVYRARDTRLSREVAIKVLPAEVAGDAARLTRFEKEARTASALNHPNIVTIYDIGQTDSVSWMAMELVERAGRCGRSLPTAPCR